MNQVIDLKRLGFLARKDFFQIWRGSAITAGAVAGLVLVISLLWEDVDYDTLFAVTLVAWGCVAASLSFHELHDKTKNEDFLLLPASALEKTLVRLLWISVVLPFFILILITVSSLLSKAINFLIFNMSPKAFNPFAGENWNILGFIVVLQSFFFLGAAWFKKAHLVKTILTIIVLHFIFGLLGALMFRIAFGSYFYDFFTPIDFYISLADALHDRFPTLKRILENWAGFVGYGLLAPLFWFVAWLRVMEAQSSDGV